MNDTKTSVPVIPPVQQGAKANNEYSRYDNDKKRAKAKPRKSKTSQKLAREEAIENESHECKLRKIRYAKKIMIRAKKVQHCCAVLYFF